MNIVIIKLFRKINIIKSRNFILSKSKNVTTFNKLNKDLNNLNKKESDIILYKSYFLKKTQINEIINLLNIYIKLKNENEYLNENTELLKNICMSLLLNKDKLRYTDVIQLIKKLSIIKCKNYYLFNYFKDVLKDNLHILNFNELISIYFAYTNLNYFDFNFYFLIEKKIFHNINLIDTKNLIYIIQCFNKKKIITKNYLTILIYTITKNINHFNTKQLSTVFLFFKNFNINNDILLNSLIHQFNKNVNLNESPIHLSLFYNYLSYVNKKCKNNDIVKERELIEDIKNIKLDNNDIINNINKSINNICDKKNDITHLYSLLNDELYKNKNIINLKEKIIAIKKNSYNYNLMYTIKNTLEHIEIITKKQIKNMSILSLCLISSCLSNINKNKFLLERIAEEIGKKSTNISPSLLSHILLSFSKANHKHGSLIYYSLKFFYKYNQFFNINEIGILCKCFYNFSMKEYKFIDILNDIIPKNVEFSNFFLKIKKEKEYVNNKNINENKYINNYLNYNSSNDKIEKLFYEIENNLEKKNKKRYYEDNLKNVNISYENINYEKYEQKENKNIEQNINYNLKDISYDNFNFTFIDYNDIKKNNYIPNYLYNIKVDKISDICINNIIYILEYYSFNLIYNKNVLNTFCEYFLEINLNYILYCRIFYSFYLLQYKEYNVYELIQKFNNTQPLYQAMYKEKHLKRLTEALKYFYENKNEQTEMKIYFYVLLRKSFSFIFNFSKYLFTFLLIKNNINLFNSFIMHIKNLPFENDDYIFIHKPNNLYQ